MTVLPRISPRSNEDRQAKIQRQLIQKEAEIGGQLFGAIPKGRRRQFFCLDRHTWVWHEEWQDAKGKRQSVTTRYEVRPNGIIKIQDGHVYQRVTPDETRNLFNSAKLYYQRVSDYYDKQLQAA
jgi:hypothetical protein